MKTEKNTVSIRLELDKEIHKKIKLIQAKLLLEQGKQIGLTELCTNLLANGVDLQMEQLQIRFIQS